MGLIQWSHRRYKGTEDFKLESNFSNLYIRKKYRQQYEELRQAAEKVWKQLQEVKKEMTRASTKIVAMETKKGREFVLAKFRRYNLWNLVIYECRRKESESTMSNISRSYNWKDSNTTGGGTITITIIWV